MRYITSILQLFLLILLVLLISFETYCATAPIVSIKLNGVTVIPGPTKTIEVCFGATYNLEASNAAGPPTAGSDFNQWKNLDSLVTITSFQINTPNAGRWVATIKNTASGLTASDTVHLVYATTSSLQIMTTNGVPITTTNVFVCGTSDSTFLASPNHTNYKWYKNSTANLISTTNTLTITNTLLSSSDGAVSFFVSATNSSGCIVTAQKSFRRDVSVTVNLGPDLVKCTGTSVKLESPSSPSGILFPYKWNTGAATPFINVNTSANYRLTITNTATKCSISDNVLISFNAAPIIKITKDTIICNGTSVQLNASVIGGTGPYTYSWTSNPDLSNISINNPIVTPSSIGINTYSVAVSDPLGCGGTTSTSTNITQLVPFTNPYFTIEAGNDTTICFKSTAILKPTVLTSSYAASYSWNWSPTTGLDNPSSQNPNLSIDISGVFKYVVTATDDRGCKLKDSLNVKNLFELTTTTNFTDTLSCVETPITLIASANGGSGGGYSYNFAPTQGIISGNELTIALKDSVYIIDVTTTDGDGCISPSVPVNLTGYRPFIKIASGDDTTSYGGKALNLIANIKNKPSVTVVWHDVFTADTLEYGLTYTSTIDESVYAFATDNFYNCTNSDSVTIIHRIEDIHALFIPNVFSPKATNPENQRLKVFGTLIQETGFNFRIYNQWGLLVYQTSSFNEANSIGWTGEVKSNEGKQSSNVYTYTLEGKFLDGLEFAKTGTTTMLQ